MDRELFKIIKDALILLMAFALMCRFGYDYIYNPSKINYGAYFFVALMFIANELIDINENLRNKK